MDALILSSSTARFSFFIPGRKSWRSKDLKPVHFPGSSVRVPTCNSYSTIENFYTKRFQQHIVKHQGILETSTAFPESNTKFRVKATSGHHLESEPGAYSNTPWNSVKNALDSFYRFSRPHTVIGTKLSDISSPFYSGVLEAVVAALMMNIYIVGINQLTDIEIDKISRVFFGRVPAKHSSILSSTPSPSQNSSSSGVQFSTQVQSFHSSNPPSYFSFKKFQTSKVDFTVMVPRKISDETVANNMVNKPYLPLASGEYSTLTGIMIVTSFSIMSFSLGWIVGSWPLFWALFVSFVLGTAYSVNLPLLRWKRFALVAAMCILAVRAVIVQLAFYLHIQTHVFSRPAVFSKPLIFATAFMSFFSVVIALFKDIPDIEGDKIFGIKSYTVRLSQERVFWTCISLLEMAYGVSVLVGATSSYTWSKVITVCIQDIHY
ncbi:Homogentisate geranylgeranyltransferase [Hibiscus syriacus]|uniref:Homogentisate geranylgeranyltransferase n=1 Tax=Hibiscus syriacus TaxID=106335 RepID=A0A6A2YGB7_HIBSY|nr:Homogentisate geranylgeranyltransferase [Hibiscus syriacus]